MRVLFFGNSGVLQEEGKASPSSVVRVTNVAAKLAELGYDCEISYVSGKQVGRNKTAIMNSDVVIFHRIQASRRLLIEPSFLPIYLFAKNLRKKVVFDFDDAIFLTFPLVCDLCLKLADAVFAGSHMLLSRARLLNKRAFLVPSAVNTDLFAPHSSHSGRRSGELVIGWHGSARGHFRNLAPIKPVLEELGKKCPFTLRLLGTEGSPFIHDYFRIPNVKTVFGPNEWIPYNQLPLYLQDTDIGISPLADNIWNRAKCAMKAIEYMSLGKPVVASNVGEHRYVIRKGINGFLTENAEDWVSTLENLAMNSDIRRRVGEAARETAVEYYSLKKIAHLVSGLLEEIT